MDIFVRCLIKIVCCLEAIFLCLYQQFNKSHRNQVKKIVKPSSDPLLKLSATALAKKIRTKELKSEDIIKAYIKRIKNVNPIINAVVEDRFEAAIAEAKRVDGLIKTDSKILENEKPLFGVPITIKESIPVKGMSYTGCSKIRKGARAEEDNGAVAYLKAAGAIPLLVSNIPEYCFSVDTRNDVIGRTVNPYNTLYVSGGSSGGEAALVASGASVLGIGSDIMGSVRIPCALNGIFGHKPTAGILPLTNHIPMSTDEYFSKASAVGPIVRYAEDLRLGLQVMAGPNAAKLKLDEKVNLKRLRIYFMEDCRSSFGNLPVDKKIKSAIKAATKYLASSSGCTICDRKFPDFADSAEITQATVLRSKEFSKPFDDAKVEYNFTLELIKSIFGKSLVTLYTFFFVIMVKAVSLLLRNPSKYVEKMEKLRKTMIEELKDDGIFLYPSYPTSAYKPGVYFKPLLGLSYLGIFNSLGFPACTVPVGFNDKGLPVALQVVAAPYQDRLCFAAAEELEKFFHGWQLVLAK